MEVRLANELGELKIFEFALARSDGEIVVVLGQLLERCNIEHAWILALDSIGPTFRYIPFDLRLGFRQILVVGHDTLGAELIHVVPPARFSLAHLTSSNR